MHPSGHAFHPHVCPLLHEMLTRPACRMCGSSQTILPMAVQAVAQLEAETQQVFQENQQLNKQSNLLNNDVGCRCDALLLTYAKKACLCTPMSVFSRQFAVM